MATKTIKFQYQADFQNPSLTPAITVVDGDGSIQDTGTMSHLLGGKYSYDFTATVGEYYYAKIVAENRQSFTKLELVEATVDTSSVSGITPASGSYTSTLEVVRVSGLQLEVVDENVGTGDNSETDFDLDFDNIIATSYTIYHGASGSNSMTDLTETTHYSLDKASGRILLTASGVTALGTDVMYAKYVYSDKMSDTSIGYFISKSDAEVERITGRIYGTTQTVTEFFDGRVDEFKHYPTTDEPYMRDYEEPDYENLSFLPISSVQAAYFLNRGSGWAKTWSFDSTLSSYTDNTDESNSPSGTAFNAFGATAANSDILYVGMQVKFLNFNFRFSTLGVGSPTLAFEYWNGTTWTAVSNDSDGTSGLTVNGKLSYDMPSGWTKTSVNGFDAFYIRVRFASGSYTTDPTIFELTPDQNGVINTEIPLYKIDITDEGRLTFLGQNIPNGVRNVRVDYTYGSTNVPAGITELSALLASIRIFANITGGSYNDFTSYQLGAKQVSIGEVYVNVREVVRQMEQQIERIMKKLPKNIIIL